MLSTAIGLTAAFCTTVSYVPQLRKCWQTGKATGLSLTMFLILASGVTLWIVYGYLQGDAVIMLANSASLVLLMGILFFKCRDRWGNPPTGKGDRTMEPEVAVVRLKSEPHGT